MPIKNIIKIEVKGSLLVRNTMLNFIGQATPLLVGVSTIPFIVRELGIDRFGLLSLAWVVLGYFTIFDLGLGWAATKYVAESLGKGDEEQVPCLVWTAVTIQAFFGLAGALALFGITPLLVERIFNIPLDLRKEAEVAFYLLALAIPMVFVSTSFRGALQATQRFDLVNAVNIPSNALIFLLPLVGILLGLHVPGIIALILGSKFMALLALFLLNLRIFPKLNQFSIRAVIFRRLFRFGRWVMVKSIISPILMYMERFLIASLLSMVALAYYTVPCEAVIRLSIIPSSLAITLFPAFSTLEVLGNRKRLGIIFAYSIKYSLLSIGPIVIILILFAEEILQAWLGPDFSAQSTVVLQILSLGVLFNFLARSPSTLLLGTGRPDIPAKFHLLELPLHIGVAWILVSWWGIAGAAVAWTLRVILDALLLFVATFKIHRFSSGLLSANGTKLASLSLVVLTGIAFGLKRIINALPLFIQSLFVLGLLGLFAWFSWRSILDESERKVVIKAVKIWK